MAYRSVSNFRISIHALREEGDNSAEAATNRAWQISIHALREEGDNRTSGAASKTTPFLSTPSARRATVETGKKTKTEVFLSTPSARRATSAPASARRWCCYFYPRPPRGGRPKRRTIRQPQTVFLSTPSARRATPRLLPVLPCPIISIHALREEGDRRDVQPDHPIRNFYPRPPRGGRPATALHCSCGM